MQFAGIEDVIAALNPREPVYCIYPHILKADVRRFIDGFPGRVMYALKANPDPRVLQQVINAGIADFDAASIEEMQQVHALDAAARLFFMAPVRFRGAVRRAYTEHGVRHYVIDHIDELRRITDELPTNDVVIFVRMAANNSDATYDLSEKFGAGQDDTLRLLREVADIGMEPALAFNVGSLVRRPAAYVTALENCARVIDAAGCAVNMLDVGGGFPSDYPGMRSAPLGEFFRAIDETRRRLPQLSGIELLAEPGRALIAGGVSLLAQVLHRTEDRVFLNDGIWGSMIETMLSKGELQYPTRSYCGAHVLDGEQRPFEVFGPTCDSLDRLPSPMPLPLDLRAGDWIEFGTIGAYSLSNRTRFNGFYPDTLVEITATDSVPPRIA
ncbi:MAG TPA: hypothetical protein VFE85_05180 [Woeseiaceae bacterium]|nr:hypothetical protein [Woeseiaceae bacterium]